MARVRWIGPEPVNVPELGDRTVEPDEIVDVPDERYWGYACQTANWEPIEEPPNFEAPDKEPDPEAAPAPDPVPETAELPPALAAPVPPTARKTTAKTQKEV